MSIARVIESALDAVKPALDNKSIVVSAAIEVGSAVYGDAARLEQVVWNLLTNAVADIGLPHEDGLWLIGEVRRREGGGRRRVPAVALTAFATSRDRA